MNLGTRLNKEDSHLQAPKSPEAPLVSLRLARDLGTWPRKVPELAAWAEHGYPEIPSSGQEDFKLKVMWEGIFKERIRLENQAYRQISDITCRKGQWGEGFPAALKQNNKEAPPS